MPHVLFVGIKYTSFGMQRIYETAMEHWRMGAHLITWGILTKKWRPFIDEHLMGTRKSSVIRMSSICNKIWEVTDVMWRNRNDKEHNIEDSEVNVRRNQSADQDIDRIYDMLPPVRYLPMIDRQFFRNDKQRHKKKKT